MKKLFFLMLIGAVTNYCVAQSFKLNSQFGTENAMATAEVKYQFIPSDGKIFLAYGGDIKILTENGYQYKGKIYKPYDVSGLATLLSLLRGNSPNVTFKVYYKSTFKGEFTRSMDGLFISELGDGLDITNVSKPELADIPGWRVEGISLNSFSRSNFDRWWDVDKLISKYESDIKDNRDFDLLSNQANAAFSSGDYLQAKLKYTQALRYKKNESYINQQLVAIENAIRSADKKRQYDAFITLANSAKTQKNYVIALENYNGALTTGYNDSFARQQANLMSAEINRLRTEQEAATKIANEELSTEKLKAAKQTEEANLLKAQKETDLKILQKVAAENEANQLARLAEVERQKVETDRETQRIKEKEELEAKEKKKQEEREQRKKVRRKELDDRIDAMEKIMQFNPEKLKESLQLAKNEGDNAQAINPYSALTIKPDWYDANAYMEEFRDDLNEPKRRQANEDYYRLLLSKAQAVNSAQNLYFEALSYAENGSSTHKNIINQINFLEAESEGLASDIEFNAEQEQLRRKFRESNKVMLKIQKMEFNSQRTVHAFQTINYINALNRNSDGSTGAQAYIQQYELERRLNQAQETTKANNLVAGAATGAAMSAMFDDSKQAQKYGVNSMGINARLMAGYMGIPITVNTALSGYVPSSQVKSLEPVHIYAELDFWLLRNNHVDLGVTGGGLFGVEPFDGHNNSLFAYHGTAKINAGSKEIKLALEGTFMQRIGVYKVDNDVAAASAGYELTSNGARDAITEGKFNYSVTKLGAGLHINISNEENEKYIRALVYAEQISFLKNSFTKNPVYSYALEFSIGNGVTFAGEYAGNYVVGGTPKYEITPKNKALWAFRFGKVFTLVKSK